MDDLFGETDCRSKSDSIVMRLLRSAMDKAHENVQSQNGPIEFLHERSKFYELAAILVDGGLSIVQEEADNLETSHEKMLSDLREIKDWLRRRIEEMKLLIIEKDKELLEREENELKLRHALDLSERELGYLQERLEFERMKTEEFEDVNPSNEECKDESQGGDICELKNSVDQQVLNIKQKLESEHLSSIRRRRASISCASGNELYSQFLENRRHSGSEFMEDVDLLDNFPGIKLLSSSLKPGKNNAMVKQMRSNIDILKGTLDLAFGRMLNVEVFPLEKQWKWSIERDALFILLEGFMTDVKQKCKPDFEKKDCSFPLGFCREKWKEFINDIRTLHCELKAFCSQINEEEKQHDRQEMAVTQSSLRKTTSEPLPDVFLMLPDKDPDPSGKHNVAKMIQSHESFIQKHREREEWSWLTREILRIKKEKDPNELESRITKTIIVLESLIQWDDNLRVDKNFCHSTNSLEPSIPKFDRAANDNRNAGDDADFCDEMRKIKEERDDLELQFFIFEEIYLLAFRSFMKNLQAELFNYEKENCIRDGSNRVSMTDVQDDRGVTKTNNIDIAKAGKLKDGTAFDFSQHYLEKSIRVDVYEVYFQESISEWNKYMECNADDCLVEEEIGRIVLNESMRCIECTGNLVKNRLKKEIEVSEALMANLSCSNTLPETVGSIIKEDVYAVYFRELFNEWRTERDALDIEMLIREDIYQFVMVEMMKEFHATLAQSQTSAKMNFSEDFPSPIELDIPAELGLIEKIDSSSVHRKACSQTMEHSEQCDEVSEHDNVELLSNDDEKSLSTVCKKFETSAHQLLESKAMVLEKERMTLADSKEDDHHTQIDKKIEIDSQKQHPSCQPEKDKILLQNTSDFSPLMEFQQAFMDFEHTVHKKIESNCLRLDKLKPQINAFALLASAVRRKKVVYKKAFVTRCQNLRLAETEVDLLGNQVDKLLCLLQNIYLILNQKSAVLSQIFGVFDILRWIKKELSEGAACKQELYT